MNRVLIAGTDTGVGKTWMACALARALRNGGRSVVAVKPVETGCGDEPSPDEDGVRLAAATGQARPSRALRRFRAPLAPAVAADREGGAIDIDDLIAEIESLTAEAEVALLEGAGGLLSPCAWDWSQIDLAQSTEATALVVTSDRLGSINHTLLTLSALDLAGVRVAGVVVSAPAVTDASSGSNAGAIARLSGIERVCAAPRVTDPVPTSPWLLDIAGWL